MVLPLYLAMTAAELSAYTELPPKIGYMACHFSPYGTGLSNCPVRLPQGAMVILNDRTPIAGHDPQTICRQLEEITEVFNVSRILLDFQRPNCPETAELVHALRFRCPMGVSAQYAREDCPVFLPPVPLDTPLQDYLTPWADREIWLDVSLEGLRITVTAQGAHCQTTPYAPLPSGQYDEALCCHYTVAATTQQAVFQLYRTADDLRILLEQAEALGVTTAVGLYQELGAEAEIFHPTVSDAPPDGQSTAL